MKDFNDLETLKKELRDMKEYHREIWKEYGSELCTGEMIRKEEEIEEVIQKIINKN